MGTTPSAHHKQQIGRHNIPVCDISSHGMPDESP